jgi:hypothetical protein
MKPAMATNIIDAGYQSRILLKLQSRLRESAHGRFRGYPLPTSKKKRACVVTYRHSGEQLFKNSVLPRPIINDL